MLNLNKQFIQFGRLKFDDVVLLDCDSGDIGSDIVHKVNPQSYSYDWGDYVNFKNEYMCNESIPISLSVYVNQNKYKNWGIHDIIDFITYELSKPSKLWCIQNGKLLWAKAFVKSYREFKNGQGMLEYDLDLLLYEGYFHLADGNQTHIDDIVSCEFLEEYFNVNDYDICDCDCGWRPENKLNNRQDILQNFNSNDYIITLNEDLSPSYIELTKSDCCDTFNNRFIYNGSIPSDDITIVVEGTNFKNLDITINGNKNIIEGVYDGALTIYPSGDLFLKGYYNGGQYCDYISIDHWKIPYNMKYGWTMAPKINRVQISDLNCTEDLKVKIKVEERYL